MRVIVLPSDLVPPNLEKASTDFKSPSVSHNKQLFIIVCQRNCKVLYVTSGEKEKYYVIVKFDIFCFCGNIFIVYFAIFILFIVLPRNKSAIVATVVYHVMCGAVRLHIYQEVVYETYMFVQ